MKVTVSRKGLLDALAAVGSVPAARTTRPELQMVRADLAGGTLSLSATDLETAARYDVAGAEGADSGACLLPPDRLLQILRRCPEDRVTLDAGKEKVRIASAAGRFDLPAADAAAFPAVEPLPDANPWTIDAAVLRTLFARVVFAAERDESGKWLTKAVQVEFGPAGAALAATDTHVLAVARGPAAPAGGGECSPAAGLIPLKAAAAVARLVEKEGGAATVWLGRGAATVRTERGLVRAVLAAGRFPPHRDILAANARTAKHRLELPAVALLDAVEAAAIVSDKLDRRVEFRFRPGLLALSARGDGEAEVEVPLPGWAGTVDVWFDPVYLTGFLKAAGPAAVTLELAGDAKPVLFRCGPDWDFLASNIVA